jgi:EpsD family peptidyl-prolyl cis-trans isomerase
MFFQNSVRLAIALACLALGGCRFDFWHKGTSQEPAGQVVATVDGQEITLRDLRAELAGAAISNPKARKAAEQAALLAVARRVVLANAAKAQGVDREPSYVIAKQRADDLVLIQELQRKIARSVPAPSRDEAELYIADHPDVFAQRKVFTVEQIRIGSSKNPKLFDELKALNNLDDIAALLNRENTTFVRGMATIDAVGQDPKIVEGLLKLPPNEVFLMAQNGGAVAGQIHKATVVPFAGEPAINYALWVLKQQREKEAVTRTIGQILAKANSNVKFNKNYAPANANLSISTNQARK